MVVASTLLMAVMAIVTPTAIRNAQLARDTRDQSIAMDELANEMERLTSLDENQRNLEMQNLVVSDHLREILHDAEMTAREVSDNDGHRIVLSMQWERIGDPKPISLVGWVDPISSKENQ